MTLSFATNQARALKSEKPEKYTPEEKEPIPERKVQVHDIHHQLSNSIRERIREQTASDLERNALKKMIRSGWLSTTQCLKTLLTLS